MNITMIAAADTNWGIGFRGGLPWYEPDDLKHFKQRTLGKTLLVGRRTKDTLPPLRGRRVFSVSRTGGGDYRSISEAVEELRRAGLDELIIAGGGEIFAASLKIATSAEISRITGIHECDIFMPNLLQVGWIKISESRKACNLIIEKWIRNDHR